uniref:Rhamnogalacturonan lyase domain-containing protein n=1 Tax=Manihot esculenta TaxID=3983 RepID=A0A2C9U1L7_MANES
MSSQRVKLHIQERHVVMDNGILQVTISKPEGIVTGIRYNGISNLLEVRNDEPNGGYWDLVWSKEGSTGTTGTQNVIKGTNFKVIMENEEQVETSFTKLWDPSLEGQLAPLNIDKRFIMLRNSSGFYSYAIYEHLQEWPAFNVPQTRIVFKLRKDKFRYMVVADNRQRFMPLPEDRLPPRGKPLDVPEAVLLVDPVEPEFKGEVDDKYQYSCENRNLQVHGWICFDPPVGFWQITPSNEFRSGGPLKQNLTSHVGPLTLAMFLSAHYVGEDMVLKFKSGEPWKKVFGPVFIYLNTLLDANDPQLLWEDAKEQMLIEVQSWPYSFPASEDFPTCSQRGNVSGRLLVRDSLRSYSNSNNECFSSCASCDIDLGDIVYEPPRDGPTLWEIGMPDRSAAEFYVPDPDPMYINKLYVNHPDRFRQYGLWTRYTDLYPDSDLVYTIGTSDYSKDWFYAQVPRKTGDGNYQGTTWQIKFRLENPNKSGTYNLRLALATANSAELQVRINDPGTNLPLFSTGVIGHDNTITRHGIHGLYRLYSVEIPGAQLLEEDNTIFLTQTMVTSPFQAGIMYDYIRLEGPASSNS